MPRTNSLRTRVLAGAAGVVAAAALSLGIGASAAGAAGPDVDFGFNARAIQGAPTGVVRMTGGGSFDASTGAIEAGGGFRCTSSVNQGPLTGCLAGEGVRWRAAQLLPSTPFKCTGATSEALKTGTTDQDTVALRADFFRAGDGNNRSFTANVIVSATDIAPDIAGVQNAWIQNVGCATSIANFSS
jgi:hypothetical protein